MSQEVSACMNAYTRSPVSTRRLYHAAYIKSLLTDISDDVGANTSSLTVVAKSFKTHRVQPVSKMDLPEIRMSP